MNKKRPFFFGKPKSATKKRKRTGTRKNTTKNRPRNLKGQFV